jgi:hypothetical protein
VPLRKDIWRPAIVEAPAAELFAGGRLDGPRWHWLPEEGPFRFLADPFGLWRGGRLHLFAERFDYRDRIGRIELFVYDDGFRLVERGLALAEPWHLSYPFVFEGEGETWLLPEAHRSGRLTLYRAEDFPWRWRAAAVVALDAVPIDASIVRRDGLWWLFYSPATTRRARTGALHAAFADRLTGPWTPHPANPVRVGPDGSRPGGTPVLVGGALVLPVQDCRTTYGGAMRPLRVERLTPDRFDARLGDAIRPPAAARPYLQGLHTLSAAGPVTLVDVKRTELSARGLGIEVRRRMRRLVH